MVASSTIPNTFSNVRKWGPIATGDSIESFELKDREAILATVTISGTFGGSTVLLQGSNDGTNFFTINDATGSPVSATSISAFEISTVFRFIRPAISAGTADAVDVLVSLVG